MAESGVERFVEELRELGYEPKRHGPDEVSFEYEIENGPRDGALIELGFVVPPSWPIEPPHGPCYRPAILREAGIQEGVHQGRHLGPEWDHWSRPFEGWARVEQSLRSYMRLIRNLNKELPPEPLERANAA